MSRTLAEATQEVLRLKVNLARGKVVSERERAEAVLAPEELLEIWQREDLELILRTHILEIMLYHSHETNPAVLERQRLEEKWLDRCVEDRQVREWYAGYHQGLHIGQPNVARARMAYISHFRQLHAIIDDLKEEPRPCSWNSPNPGQ